MPYAMRTWTSAQTTPIPTAKPSTTPTERRAHFGVPALSSIFFPSIDPATAGARQNPIGG